MKILTSAYLETGIGSRVNVLLSVTYKVVGRSVTIRCPSLNQLVVPDSKAIVSLENVLKILVNVVLKVWSLKPFETAVVFVSALVRVLNKINAKILNKSFIFDMKSNEKLSIDSFEQNIETTTTFKR